VNHPTQWNSKDYFWDGLPPYTFNYLIHIVMEQYGLHIVYNLCQTLNLPSSTLQRWFKMSSITTTLAFTRTSRRMMTMIHYRVHPKRRLMLTTRVYGVRSIEDTPRVWNAAWLDVWFEGFLRRNVLRSIWRRSIIGFRNHSHQIVVQYEHFWSCL
jgi:hypothetical protein